MSQQKCATCSVACRGNQCRKCFRSKGKSSNTDDTILYSDLFSSQPNANNDDLTNASFANNSTVDAVEETVQETTPTSVEDLYDMFTQMRSEFKNIIREKDAVIASLTVRVESLEKSAKKKVGVNPPDVKLLTEMKEFKHENDQGYRCSSAEDTRGLAT